MFFIICKGLEEGLTQTAKKSTDDRQCIIFNFPLDITWKSTNPYGCKYLVHVLYIHVSLNCKLKDKF